MGTGKTAVAREVSKKLGIPTVDTDQLIVEREGMSISQLFEEKGESYFRNVENTILRELQEADDEKIAVISLGGGTPVHEPNRELIKQLGYVVWLKTSAEVTHERVSKNNSRPLLQGEQDPLGKIKAMMEERFPIYAEISQFKINTVDLHVSELAGGIIDSASYFFSEAEDNQPK